MLQRCDIETHMRADHGRYSATMFGVKRPYKCSACNGALAKDPSEDEHVCKPWFITRRPKNSSENKEPFQG